MNPRLALSFLFLGLLGISLGFLGTVAAEAGWCGGGGGGQCGRSPASLAAIQIRWERIDFLARPDAVVTGQTVDDDAKEVSPFSRLEKPVVVFVADPTAPIADFEKLEEVVFRNEKIGLAMKAFRAVRISPENAEEDLILAGHGKTVPRMIVIDPVKERVKVIEAKKIKASSLFKAMKSVSGSFYKEKLDKLVKGHLKILNERDKLHNEGKVLRDKEGRLADETGKKAEKDLKKIRGELEELNGEIEELATKERELWKLTPKNAAA